MGGGVGRRQGDRVLDEVAEVGVFLLTDWRLQRDRLLRDLHDLADLLRRDLHPAADLLGGRLAAVLLHEAAADADELVDRLDHVHRDADRARLVGDRARDRLADPPGRVGGELEALAVVELLDRADQADVAFLDQVQQRHAAADVLLRHRDDEAEVGLRQALLRGQAVLLQLVEVRRQLVFAAREDDLRLEVGRQQGVLAGRGGHGGDQLRLEDVGDDRKAHDRARRVFRLDVERLRDALHELDAHLGVERGRGTACRRRGLPASTPWAG